ncbi:MAG: flagellar motor protein MotA [Alphaproteobacteria bacterium]
MTRPWRYLVRMAIFLVAVLALAGALLPVLEPAFMANAVLNGVIVGVFLIGVVFIFAQVIQIGPEVAWVEAYRGLEPGAAPPGRPPRLLSTMATMLGDRVGRVSLSAISLRSLLDTIGSRLDESRETSRYIIGLLVFLGLLGTFWGLLQTVGAIGDVIDSLEVGASSDLAAMFDDLKLGLEQPVAGMGTAFSSSLFGLAGSLALGFLELQAGQARNRFYNDLEEWLSSVTRLSSASALTGDGDQHIPAYIQALLEQTADSLENLQRTITRGEESRLTANANLMALTERLTTLTDQMRAEQTLMRRIAETQVELKPVLTRLGDAVSGGALGIDDESRAHIRNLEVYAARLLEEMTSGRADSVQEIRSEIKMLARTIAALADEASA